MKQLTEAQLRELAIRLYDEGFQSGVDAVSMDGFQSGLVVDRIDIEARDDLIDLIISEV